MESTTKEETVGPSRLYNTWSVGEFMDVETESGEEESILGSRTLEEKIRRM